jgi:hypothetical protein
VRSRGFLLALLVLLFLALRIALLVVREPFFDELFTVWIARKPFAGILEALRQDSGPPLYYFLVRALGLKSVFAARVLSLVFATAGFAALLAARQYTGAMLVAVFPPSVLFSVDARSYALCATLVTFAVLAIDRKRPWIGCVALVLAAYSHYYAVLFFPLLWRHWRAMLVALIAFAPGFWLAVHQPPEALAWRQMRWPDALFLRPPIVLLVTAVVLLAIAAIRRSLIPLALSVVAGVYVPMRFESVAAPLLAIDLDVPPDSLLASPGVSRMRTVHALAVAPLLVVCALISVRGILDHAHSSPDDYALAARWVGTNVSRSERVVATGYLYLETVTHGREDAEAFPSVQAIHPGWRALAEVTDAPPSAPFVWIGEAASPERRILERNRRLEPLYVNGRAMVARVR